MAMTTEWNRKQMEKASMNDMREQLKHEAGKMVKIITEKMREFGVTVGVTGNSFDDRLCAIGMDRELTPDEVKELHGMGFEMIDANNLGRSRKDNVTAYFKY